MRSLAAVLLAVLTTVASATPDDLPSELRRWVVAQPALPDFMVGFEMTRRLPALKDPLVSKGQLTRHRDGRFEWRIGEPAVSKVSFDGTTLKAWEEGGEWRELDEESRKARSWLMFLGSQNDTLRELDRRFTVRVLESTPASVTVALDPRAAMTRKYLREIRLTFSPQSHHLKQLRITQGKEASTEIEFAEPEAVAVQGAR
jgi:hypothetical protein